MVVLVQKVGYVACLSELIWTGWLQRLRTCVGAQKSRGAQCVSAWRRHASAVGNVVVHSCAVYTRPSGPWHTLKQAVNSRQVWDTVPYIMHGVAVRPPCLV